MAIFLENELNEHERSSFGDCTMFSSTKNHFHVQLIYSVEISAVACVRIDRVHKPGEPTNWLRELASRLCFIDQTQNINLFLGRIF